MKKIFLGYSWELAKEVPDWIEANVKDNSRYYVIVETLED